MRLSLSSGGAMTAWAVVVGVGLAFGCTADVEEDNGAAAKQDSDAGSGRSGAEDRGSAGASSDATSHREAYAGIGGEAVPGSSSERIEDCAEVEVRGARVNPSVTFVIDGSNSMAEDFPGAVNRWEAMRTALFDPVEGLVAKLQSVVRFGMVVYSGPLSIVSTPGELCEELAELIEVVEEAPALNNLNRLAAAFPEQPLGGWTPTAVGLQRAYDIMPDREEVEAEGLGQQFVVLATDGEPNTCLDVDILDILSVPLIVPPLPLGIPSFPVLVLDFSGPLDEVARGLDKGIQTFVVSLANGSSKYKDHLARLAEQGGTGAAAFSPATWDDLVQRLTGIASGALGCRIRLKGSITVDDPCSGTLELNGRVQECGGPDGWIATDPNHIELKGKACDLFMNDPGAVVQASFPCGQFAIE